MKKIVLLLAIATMAMPIFAQNPQQQKQQRKNFEEKENICTSDKMCKLNLTDEQKEKIDVLKLNHQKENNTFRYDIDILKAEYNKLLASDNASEKEINAKIDQITTIHGKKMKADAKHKREIRSLLNDEQKLIFDKMGKGKDSMRHPQHHKNNRNEKIEK
jgi:Spy/CpxP family protein refolding chaperone